MGEHDVRELSRARDIRVFHGQLLRDVAALEHLLDHGLVESGVRRIGAEQELFLVDPTWRPAPLALEVLDELGDDHFTTELALFNLEYNLEPLRFGGTCLSAMEAQLDRSLEQVRLAARRCGAEVVLVGILPTLGKSDLALESMTPVPRYHALNEALTTLRGREYEFHLKGTDELHLRHDSILVEACNTSFQVHFQVGPDEFPRLYNASQAVLAPVLAAAANSALLFGRRLWRETRVGLFQQSIDTRSTSPHVRVQVPRVSFGRSWVESSALEIFRDDIARFRSLLAAGEVEDPFAAIAAGRAPQLQALRLHNGTVYRWNRICYGISEDVPHLRIENRILPSGPTPRDEVANAAFWFGLVSGVVDELGDITRYLPFDQVRANFLSAARYGLNAQLVWVDGRFRPAAVQIREFFLPLARRGLLAAGIDDGDVDLYLGVIEDRVATGQTGAQWQLASYAAMGETSPVAERMAALTSALVHRQATGEPVHTWPPATLAEGGGWDRSFLTVEQVMDSDLVTVHPEESVELAATLMEWKGLGQLLVEGPDNTLVGLVSQAALVRRAGATVAGDGGDPPAVAEVMETELVVVVPDTPTLEAIELMRRHRLSCLPVVVDDHLVGMVTETRLMTVAKRLLEDRLRHSERE